MEKGLRLKNQKRNELIHYEETYVRMKKNEVRITIKGKKKELVINEELSEELVQQGFYFVNFEKNNYEERFYLTFTEQKSPPNQELIFSKSNLIMTNSARISDIFYHLKIEMKKNANYILRIERLTNSFLPDFVPFLIANLEIENQ